MSQAFAPRPSRGLSWFGPAIAAIGLAIPGPLATAQQAPPKGDDAKAKAKPEDPKAKAGVPKVEEAPDASEAPADDEGPITEIFLDPNAKAALAKIEPLNAGGPAMRVGPGGTDGSTILNMATGSIAVDPAFLKRYVEFFAAELTKRDYINALINPPDKPSPTVSRGLERAVDALVDPLTRARATNQSGFLTAYNRVLFDSSLVKILDNNLFSRIDAMIVLGTAGSNAPNALDLYTAQLRKADQVLWVKQWAARGITNATDQGRTSLDATKTIEAADALVGLLNSDPKLPWIVQRRALEALGSLRLSYNKVRKPVDAASVVLRFLSDPEAHPEVRGAAAWALGMMKIPPQVTPFNFELAGRALGDLAIDLGNRIVEEYDLDPGTFEKRKDRAARLFYLLTYQVFTALSGEDDVTESGLLRSTNPGLNAAKPVLTKVVASVKDVSRESYELLRAGGNAQKGRRDELEAKIAALKGVVTPIDPKSRRLVPDGPEFPPRSAQVAGAPGR